MNTKSIYKPTTAEKVLKLRVQGKTFKEIARKLDLTAQRVNKIYNQEMARMMLRNIPPPPKAR